jgi:transcription initiation factor TFIID subunit TAF12
MISNKACKPQKREKNGVWARAVHRFGLSSPVNKKGKSLKRKELARTISKMDLEELIANGFFLDEDIDDKDKVYVTLLKELDMVLEGDEE